MARVMTPKDERSLVVSKFTVNANGGREGRWPLSLQEPDSQHCTQDHPSVSSKCSPVLFHAYTLSCLLNPLEVRADHIHLWCLLFSAAPSAAICKSTDCEFFLGAESKAVSSQCCSVSLEGVREMLQAGRDPESCFAVV